MFKILASLTRRARQLGQVLPWRLAPPSRYYEFPFATNPNPRKVP